MKSLLLSGLLAMILLAGCSGPGGPATRAGRAVDNAVDNVGEGLQRAGRKIERAVEGD